MVSYDSERCESSWDIRHESPYDWLYQLWIVSKIWTNSKNVCWLCSNQQAPTIPRSWVRFPHLAPKKCWSPCTALFVQQLCASWSDFLTFREDSSMIFCKDLNFLLKTENCWVTLILSFQSGLDWVVIPVAFLGVPTITSTSSQTRWANGVLKDLVEGSFHNNHSWVWLKMASGSLASIDWFGLLAWSGRNNLWMERLEEQQSQGHKTRLNMCSLCRKLMGLLGRPQNFEIHSTRLKKNC